MNPFRILAATLVLSPLAIHAQGSLDPPPGPPAPTMKTLEQIEPRTLISSLPFSIREPGSYYLTADLTGTSARDGITVAADDVTIDLSGFTLRGTPGSLNGVIVLKGKKNISVRNGTIRGWTLNGIEAADAGDCNYENLTVTGCSETGLLAGTSATVRNCRAADNGQHGFHLGADGQITGSKATDNDTGIVTNARCQVEDCQASGNTRGMNIGANSQVTDSQATNNGLHGIVAGTECRVRNCQSTLNAQIGIAAGDGCTVTDCSAEQNSTDGIEVGSRCTVRNNSCHQNGFSFFGAGIRVTGDHNRIEGNHLTLADRGLWVTGTDNSIAANTVLSNTENYIFSSGNHLNLLISEIPETISWPATVELAGTLTGASGSHGIRVNSSNVTINLKGHALIGVPGSHDGINVVNASPDHRNLTVRNGVLRDWGGSGLNANTCKTGRVEGVAVTGNGGEGLYVGSGGSIDPSSWLVSKCQAVSNTLDGIRTGDNCVVEDCRATFNTLSGIRVTAGSLVRDCVSNKNVEHGIRAANDNRIVGNVCDDNDMDGIRLTNGDNRVDSNQVTDNEGAGINCPAAGSLVIRNTAAGNTTNYQFATYNKHGPIISLQSVTGDISGTAGSDHPWANFEY